MSPIIHEMQGEKISRLLQTEPVSVGVVLEEFGEAFWIDLVIVLENGKGFKLGLTEITPWSGSLAGLRRAELVQDEYRLQLIEGQRIQAVQHDLEGVLLLLENGFELHCLGGPGGNFPWLEPALEPATLS
jgi:hypothetical protein